MGYGGEQTQVRMIEIPTVSLAAQAFLIIVNCKLLHLLGYPVLTQTLKYVDAHNLEIKAKSWGC